MYRRGEEIIYDKTGEAGEVKSRGHFPDTIVISIGDPRRDVEVYLRNITLKSDAPALDTAKTA
jgi:hypothetical protein